MELDSNTSIGARSRHEGLGSRDPNQICRIGNHMLDRYWVLHMPFPVHVWFTGALHLYYFRDSEIVNFCCLDSKEEGTPTVKHGKWRFYTIPACFVDLKN